MLFRFGVSLYIASSRPIRDIEGFAKPRTGIETYANRGLAGIDGNISTALGIASQRKRTIALMGDLAFLHDLTGLLCDEPINLTIFVVNNNGGGIFSTLAQRGVAGFEKVFGTPHGRDLTAIAKSMGIQATAISTLAELRDEVKAPISGLRVVEIKAPDREANADLLEKIYREVKALP